MELSVAGYKSIASEQTLRFDGLTILAGANSSGKSSFMQPFLLIKQTLESHHDFGGLMLDGENICVTDATQIISKVPGNDSKKFKVSQSGARARCGASYRHKRGVGVIVDSVFLEDEKFPEGFCLQMNLKSDEIEAMIPDSDFNFIKELYKERSVKYKWKPVRRKCFIGVELSSNDKNAPPFRVGIEPTKELDEIIKKIIHVPGLRGNPERTYKIAAAGDLYPGSFEKYVAGIINQWVRYKKYKNNYEKFKEHLAQLGLAKQIRTTKVNDTSVEIEVSRGMSKNDQDCVNIADVGFGVSQTIPVLVALICAKKGQIVYIEQPELHLHPKAQFEMASIISEAVNRGVRVVLETHSAILLRGFQICVAKKIIDYKSVSLNWFTQNSDTGETEVDKADVDEYGAFGEWPEDFDDVSLDVEKRYLDAVEEAINAS